MAHCAKWRYLIDNEAFPPLHTAVYKGDLDAVRGLLQDTDQSNLNTLCHKLTPLDVAIATQNEGVVQLLLEQPGIQVNLQSGQDYPPLTRAAWHPSTNIVRSLCNHSNIETHFDYPEIHPPLFAACYDGQPDNMRALLGCHGIYTNYVDMYKRTMSHGACEKGHVTCLRVLVDNDLFEFGAKADNKMTPIENACCWDNQLNIVRYFLQNMKSIAPMFDIESADGQSFISQCITRASVNGNAEIVSVLMKHVDWQAKRDVLYECVQGSLRRNKFITAKLLLAEMDKLIARDHAAFGSERLEQLWCDTVKTDNASILQHIYQLWATVSNSFADIEEEHIAQLTKSYDISTDTKQGAACTLLYHAIRLGIPDQVHFILKHLSKSSPLDYYFSRIEDTTGINPHCLAQKHPFVSEILARYVKPSEDVVESGKQWYRQAESMSSKLSNKSRDVTISDAVTSMYGLTRKMSENSERRDYVRTVICETVHKIAEEVSKRNPLLTIDPILVGSQKENTRPLLPNEFDFLLILTKLQTYFHMVQSRLILMGAEISVNENLPDQTPKLPLSDDGKYLDRYQVLQELKKLIIDVILSLIKEQSLHECIHFHENFYFENNVPSITLLWRGPLYKDMEIKIDIVPAFEFSEFQMPYDLALTTCKYYVIFKRLLYLYEGVFQFPVAVNDAESQLLQRLPANAMEGFKFAKALRVGHLYPNEITALLQYDATYLEDYITTYMLKTSLFFITLCPKSEYDTLHPYQWTYLIYMHFKLRLIKGVLPNFFGTPRSCFMPPGRFDDILHCTEPLSEAITSERECCIKRSRLLKVTQWILGILKEFCLQEVKAFDPGKLESLAELAVEKRPLVDRKWFEYAQVKNVNRCVQ